MRAAPRRLYTCNMTVEASQKHIKTERSIMAYSIIIISLALCLIFGALLYPYVSAILLRARMLKTLRERARAYGFKYRRFYKNSFLVRNRSPKFDMVIYNEKKLYAVKLWSSYFVHNKLCVTKRGRMFERRQTRPVFQMTDKKYTFINTPRLSVPKTRLAKKYLRGREVERILLIYPSYETVGVYDGKSEIKLRTGDELFGKILYSPSAFRELLRSQAPTEQKTKKAESATADENTQKKSK